MHRTLHVIICSCGVCIAESCYWCAVSIPAKIQTVRICVLSAMPSTCESAKARPMHTAHIHIYTNCLSACCCCYCCCGYSSSPSSLFHKFSFFLSSLFQIAHSQIAMRWLIDFSNPNRSTSKIEIESQRFRSLFYCFGKLCVCVCRA